MQNFDLFVPVLKSRGRLDVTTEISDLRNDIALLIEQSIPTEKYIESFDEFISIIAKGGFIRCGWDGCSDSEAAVKSETKATIRCILSDNTSQVKNCVYSGNPATHEVIYAKAY